MKKTMKTFSGVEHEAMKERALELKADKQNGEKILLEKISEMPQSDKTLATKVHEIVSRTAPDLRPKTWYGMPAYANNEGKVVCFFQSAFKFKARYATLGFNDPAQLDDGAMWPTSFALKKISTTEEKQIIALVKKAVS